MMTAPIRAGVWMLVLIVLPMALATPVSAQEVFGAPHKRLAVLDFDYGLVRNQVAAVFGTDLDVGRGMRDLVVKHLVQDGTYTIVDVKALAKVLAQQGLAPRDLAKPDTFARMSRILGVDALVLGSVTEFGGDTVERKFTLGGMLGALGNTLEFDKVRGMVAIDARVVDLDSGEVMAVAEGRGTSGRTAGSLLAGVFSEGGIDVGALDFSSHDFEKTVLGEAVDGAAEQVAANLIAADSRIRVRKISVSGLVAMVRGTSVVLNVGSLAGLKAGDTLPVERATQEVKDPATGEVIRTLRQQIGTVEITEVQENSAHGRVLSGSRFQVGDLVGSTDMTEAGPATEATAAILADELDKHKATGIYDEKDMYPSEAILRTARTIYIQPMPYDLHVRIAAALRAMTQPLFVISDDAKTADLWMLGTVRYSERMVGMENPYPYRVLVRRLTASLTILPRHGSQRLLDAEFKAYFDQQDKLAQDKIAKDLVGKLKKSVQKN
jgi:curli biogenesis system outer membrane secretion channel CsgG